MTAWADHGQAGNGEPLAIVQRPGNAGPDTAADRIGAAGLALAQLPRHLRRKVLVRADSGGRTHEFLKWLTAKSRRLHYSTGMVITEEMLAAILKIPADAWTPAYDGDGKAAKEHGWRTSPAFWTWTAGPRACGSSSGRSARTPERSCGSPA